MVGVGEEGVEVVVAAVHELEGAEKEESVASAVAILNFEWPRSQTIRRRGLESSSAELPCSLVMFVGETRKVVGHAKVSKVPALPGELFVESVVVHPGLRGIGLGKLLMLKVEEYCSDILRATTLHLTTHDQQVFYSRCGYTFSQPVCAFGGSSKLKMDMFSKSVPAVNMSPLPSSNSDTKSSQNDALKQSNHSSELHKEAAPPPPPPAGPPPPPPPGPPPPSASPRVSSNDVIIPDVSLVSACTKALSSPSLAAVAMKLAPKLLAIEQEGIPPIDSTQVKGKNTEDAGGKMCMSKKLL